MKTGLNYPLVLAAVIAILCREREVPILTPWISVSVAERLARGLARSEIRRLTMVTRRSPRNLQSVNLLRANLKADVEHRVYDQFAGSNVATMSISSPGGSSTLPEGSMTSRSSGNSVLGMMSSTRSS